MEPAQMPINGHKARSYQLEAFELAINQNTIVYLETGSGKTLIAIMLLRSYAHLLRKPSPFIAVFLVPTVVLVTQQADAVKLHTDLKVGMYWGEMGVDYWDAATWKRQQDEYEVLVMTPIILLDALRHSFLKLDTIKVIIFDECHNARGRHPYACIMTEFYHPRLVSKSSHLPRVFGMTASPVKAKGSSSGLTYRKQILELENLMNSKVYTCASESVLTEYVPFSTAKVVTYKHVEIPDALFASLVNDLKRLREKHKSSLNNSNLSESAMDSAWKRLSKLYSMFFYCLSELGAWMALKAAESLLCEGTDIFSWTKLDVCGETIVRNFTSDAYKVFYAHVPSGPEWSVGYNIKANVDAGYLTTKVLCLFESLLKYRDLKDLRCIIFVERVIAAIVIQALLRELLPQLTGWQTEYTAGNNSGFQSQSRNTQNKIVEEFRKGTVNVIVATSILEEGLDVQSCNLVIRFDPSANVCSFIQSRGRARMQNSDFLLLVKSGDASTLNRVQIYLSSGDVMRKESLRHASLPCVPLDSELCNEALYRVETTGAIVTLSSSVALIYFYCSRLPSDGYFKPSPRCIIDEESETCKIYFPKSCPLQSVSVSGNIKMLKQLACLEACKQLHLMGALTDHLVPDIVVEEAEAAEIGSCVEEEQAKYIPPELVSRTDKDSVKLYYCYAFEMRSNFDYDVPLQNVVLALKTKTEFADDHLTFDLEANRGNITVDVTYIGVVSLTSEQVLLCQKFQITLFRVLFDHSLEKMKDFLEAFHVKSDCAVFDYLLLPSASSHQKPSIIDWESVGSVLFPDDILLKDHMHCSSRVHTKNGLICSCVVEKSLVYTPHNGHLYCITKTLNDLNANSLLKQRDGEAMTYRQYYEKKYGIDLQYERESFLNGRQIFMVQNFLQGRRERKDRGPSKSSVELPPELCFIVMSPISVSSFYSFSFVPSIMHRIESFLVALNLKNMLADHCTQNVDIPTTRVLEAITTKECQEKFHLESLETLGDSFLKYATSQQLFKTHQNQREGFLSARRQRIINNATLCKLGCDLKLQGFIRNESFDPKMWVVPGTSFGAYVLEEEWLSTTRKVYCGERRKVKSKVVADVVEALIGAFLSYAGELAALSFMNWLGIKVDFVNIPYDRNFQVHPEKLLNISHLESLLNYSFNDKSLLVEALTHGSYMLPEIPGCNYQRLEYLGDAVLDYLITMHMYKTYPGLSPGQLTDLRSASVNNDCFAKSAIKAVLHKHLLLESQELRRHIVATVHDFDQLSLASTFDWESETTFPKVLGDIIESLAGAILVDSGYNKDAVFRSIRPLLEPLVTPETMTLHPVTELHELCQKAHYIMKKPVVTHDNGVSSITVEVEANGKIYNNTCTAADKKLAQKLASKAVLKSLKDIFSEQV